MWVVSAAGSLVRIDRRLDRVTTTLPLSAVAVAADGTTVWALGSDGTLIPVDARTGRTGAPIDLPAPSSGSIAVGGGSIWLADAAEGALWRVVPGDPPVISRIPVAAGAGAIAWGAGAAWVANPARGVIERVDPDDGRVAEEVAVGGTPNDVTVVGDDVWVTVGARASALATACGPLSSGGARPDVVVVSDLPLRGGPRSPAGAMARAVAATISARGYRAGRLRVGFRSCDDSTAESGTFDAATCVANARAYARAEAVRVVIGPFNSGCASKQLPITAAAGPLPVISPTASEARLRGRGFVRLIARDGAQAPALVEALRRSGVSRLYILDDDRVYGSERAAELAVAARAEHLPVVGRGTWSGRRTARLAAAVRHARADGVYLGGLIDSGGATTLRGLRAALPARTVFAASDGFLPVAQLYATAGAWARGVLIATTLIGPPARYATAAAEVALDAIARSDGSRASIARALRATDLRSTPLGRIRFDARGELRDARVAVVRVDNGGGADTLAATDGASVVLTR